jgi:hypothetical protein
MFGRSEIQGRLPLSDEREVHLGILHDRAGRSTVTGQHGKGKIKFLIAIDDPLLDCVDLSAH